MGRNLFATEQPQVAAPQDQQQSTPKKGRNLFAPKTLDPEFDASQYGKDELLDAYKNLPRDDPRREPIKQQIIKLGNEPFERGIAGPWKSHIAGITHGMSMGLSDEINAGIAGITGGGISALGGETYDEELRLQREQMANAEKDNPKDFMRGDITGMIIPAIATMGASAPATFLGRAGINIGGGALQGAIFGAGDDDGDISSRIGSGIEGAAWGAGFGAIPTVGETIWKTGRALAKAGSNAARPLLRPVSVAEDRIANGLARDYIDYGKLSARELAAGDELPTPDFLTAPEASALRGQGHRVQLSDFGGENLRSELKTAANISPQAAKTMSGAARARQAGQASRVIDEISDMYGGEINPKQIVDSLEEEGKIWNKQNYDRAFTNPNAGHFWGPAMQNILSSPEGQTAFANAVKVMKTDAMTNNTDFLEPVFQPNAVGRQEFLGFRALDGNMVQGHGLNLNFWNEFKIQIDRQVRDLRTNGFNREASQLSNLRRDMLKHVDDQLGDGSYAKARGDAKEIFDLVGKNGKGGAIQAGGAYFKNLDAFSTSEARAAMDAMNPMERELFARGFAAEITNKLHQMGDTEDVAKLFKSSQQRMKIADALGEENAARMEALIHAEQVQGLLGKRLAGGSDTAKNSYSIEDMLHAAGQAGSYGAAGGMGYLATGDVSGIALGLATRGGFRFVNRMAAKRVANIMAEIAISEDPALINKLLQKAAADPDYMAFSRAVSQGASQVSGAGARAGGRSAAGAGGAGGAGNAPGNPTTINIPGGGLPGGAQRVDPRMPFADGGRVPLANAGLVKKAAQAAGELLGVVKKAEKAPKRITDLGVRAEVDPVMINGKDVSQWSPKDWGDFGRLNGRDDVGPVSDEDFLASLAEVPTLSGRSFTVPGGIDDVERPFSYYDLLHLKSQAVDPNDLHPDVHRRLHNRMVRSMQPGPEFDDVDRYNQLAFGMISPNQPLTPNELAMARVRAKSPEDIQAMADMAPWKLGDDVSKDDRQALSRGIAQHFGLQAKGKGGIGASGSADYSRIADMAKMHSEKPEFYRFKGAGEGGVDDAENWSNFVGRVAAQTPGLSYKTASLGTVWQDPAHAAISAIDRHMAGSFRGAMFDKASDVNKFNRRVVQKFNKGRPRGQGARSFDEMLEMPGGRGVLVDELFVELNRRGKTKLRSAKTGELNPKAPEWARNADWIREPDKVDKMSEAYVRALRENDRLAQENNQGLFANQWMIWDRLRQRLEPHEIMHPSIRHLPRMSLDQIKAADKAHSKAGYKAESGVARPSNPSGLAYFSLAAPAGGLGALVAAQDEEGGYQ